MEIKIFWIQIYFDWVQIYFPERKIFTEQKYFFIEHRYIYNFLDKKILNIKIDFCNISATIVHELPQK